MTSMEKLLTEALALPEDERARLAHELLLSLDQEQERTESPEQERVETPEQHTAAWTAELRSRLQDVREGKVELIDLDDVDAYVARQIAAVRR